EPRVPVTCRSRLGRQMELLGDETDIVPLYYHIVDNFQIQFGREEFCLVTGLRFGVEYWADYNNEDDPIPFRRRVFSSAKDGILQFVLLGLEDRRGIPDWILGMQTLDVGHPYMLLSRKKMLIVKRIRFLDLLGHLRCGYWSRSELGRMIIINVTGVIGGPSSFPTANSSFFEGAKATPSYGHNMATPNWQTTYTDLPLTTVLPKKRGDKTKNKVKNANVSPLNHGNAFADDNVGGGDVMFLGEHDTGNYLVYENVDPSKVMRDDYIDCMEFLLNPYDVYLDCHMMGYMVPDYFWRQLVPHLCMAGSHSLERPNQEGWLSGDHMNAWIKLLIRERTQNANWTVSKSGTVCVHPENKRFIIHTDQHITGTLDGSTRPYPSWNDVDWVYMPINAGGNHWVTGAVYLPNSLFYVFDSMHSEETRLMLEQKN
ncbi:phospholipase-like protein, partial [Tanacetum coccineum]